MSTIYDSPVWREDVRRAVKAVPDLDMLAGKNLMITGAAGLICSAIVDILFEYNDTHEKKIDLFTNNLKNTTYEKVYATPLHAVGHALPVGTDRHDLQDYESKL